MHKRIWGFAIVLLVLLACRASETLLTPSTPTPTPPPSPTPVVPPTLPPTDTFSGWPPPMQPLEPFAKTAVSAAMTASLDQLNQSMPPERDDMRLAAAYLGAIDTPADPPPQPDPLTVGAHQTFNIGNIVDNTVSSIDAELTAVSDHAYFWFDTGPESVDPDPNQLADIAAAFDDIYETDVAHFGSESSPGIDGDPRVYIVHASPLALCGSINCGVAGYFSAEHALPRAANPNSNEHEMFIMNTQQFGTSFYLNVLGHEFRHMIEDNHDQGDADWEAEGSATLAEELLGYPGSGQQRGNLFLQNPDQQLNSWVDSNEFSTLPYYGMGYVLNRYIYDRLGADLYRQFATSDGYGLRAVDEVAAQNGLDVTGEQLWLDWLVALAVHNEPGAPDLYRFQGAPLDTAAMTAVNDDDDFDTTVAQNAADYYKLPTGSTTIKFEGQTVVPLLNTVPYSGEMMWYAQRANYSNPRLTRTVDLRDVDTATLSYAVYVDIEQGYDFAYVSVSEDNGRTWQGLTADNMQGLSPEDNPAGSAYTNRFYTGRIQEWREERVDLSQYAGQIIQLRFEYVTDLILTYGGFALDNIAIPEINFYDDAESLAEGWTAAGFVRTAAYLPQTWHLQLVTFKDGVPQVEKIALTADQTATLTVNEKNNPILIVAASAPFTLEPAHYKLLLRMGVD